MQLRKSLITIRGEKGFTLIELLLVMAILGILASIGLGEFIERRKEAYDKQAVAKAREWLTVATVAVANQELTMVGSQSGTGPPAIPVFANMDMNPPIHWAYNVVNPDDVYEFYLASAGGRGAYYFWIPGPGCGVSEFGGLSSDRIYDDPLGGVWRTTTGL